MSVYSTREAANVQELRLLTTQQVAERLGLAYSTVTRYCRIGLFPHAIEGPATGKGRIWLIPESDLEGFKPPRPGPRPGDGGQEVPE